MAKSRDTEEAKALLSDEDDQFQPSAARDFCGTYFPGDTSIQENMDETLSNLDTLPVPPCTHGDLATSQSEPLPEGKEYHYFICYSMDDREWVHNIIDALEAPPFSLKCCIHERDFHPGREITENIGHCMSVSMRIMPVLSPEYIESPWCLHELNIAHNLSITERKKLIVPVLLRECEIPEMLRTLSYIEADKYDLHARLMTALREDSPDIMTPFNYLQKFVGLVPNGTSLEILSTGSGGCAHAFNEELNQVQRRKLEDMGVQLPIESQTVMLRLLNTCLPVTCRLMYRTRVRVAWYILFGNCLLEFLGPLIALPVILYVAGPDQVLVVFIIISGCFSVLVLLAIVVPTVVCKLGKSKTRARLDYINLNVTGPCHVAVNLRQERVPTVFFL